MAGAPRRCRTARPARSAAETAITHQAPPWRLAMAWIGTSASIRPPAGTAGALSTGASALIGVLVPLALAALVCREIRRAGLQGAENAGAERGGLDQLAA